MVDSKNPSTRNNSLNLPGWQKTTLSTVSISPKAWLIIIWAKIFTNYIHWKQFFFHEIFLRLTKNLSMNGKIRRTTFDYFAQWYKVFFQFFFLILFQIFRSLTNKFARLPNMIHLNLGWRQANSQVLLHLYWTQRISWTIPPSCYKRWKNYYISQNSENT